MYQPKEGSIPYRIIKFANTNKGRIERKDIKLFLEEEGYENLKETSNGIINRLKKNGVIISLGHGYEITEPYLEKPEPKYKLIHDEQIIFRSHDFMDCFRKADDLRNKYNDEFKIFEERPGSKDILLAKYYKTRIDPIRQALHIKSKES